MRIGIDARILDGVAGGVQQVVMGLAAGLSRATSTDDEFVFLTYRGGDDWLRPFISGPCRVLAVEPRPRPHTAARRAMRAMIRPLVDRLRRHRGAAGVTVPPRNAIVERERFDAIHFIAPGAFLTDSPSIYHPWDLQHVHLPENFHPHTLLVREVWYRTFCDRAAIVCVAAEATKRDVMQHLGVPAEKIAVVPMAPITTEYARAGVETPALPDEFLLYPAQTFRHKNHLRLLEALALLRDRDGLRVPLVACGMRNGFFADIEKRIAELRLGDQVRFVGYVEPEVLAALYARCKAVVFPSLFEGFGLPVLEAFHAGAPVASSNAASLPEVAGDAALLFDATDVEAMAGAIRRLWTDDALRAALRARGLARANAFSWDATAEAFRALYRRAAASPRP